MNVLSLMTGASSTHGASFGGAAITCALGLFGVWSSKGFWTDEAVFPRDRTDLETWRARPYAGALPGGLGFLLASAAELLLVGADHVHPGAIHFVMYMLAAISAAFAVTLLVLSAVVSLTLWPPFLLPAYLRG